MPVITGTVNNSHGTGERCRICRLCTKPAHKAGPGIKPTTGTREAPLWPHTNSANVFSLLCAFCCFVMSDASDSGNEVGSDTCTGSAATCSNEAAAPAFEDTESDAEKDVRRKWHTHKLRGAKSKVWNWFKVYTFERCSHLAICNTCGMEVNRGPKK